MARPSKYPRELRERAVRMVAEAVERGDYPSEFEAIRTIATKVGLGSPETLRKWVRHGHTGPRPHGPPATRAPRPHGPPGHTGPPATRAPGPGPPATVDPDVARSTSLEEGDHREDAAMV